jgi:hypothetical protein
MDHWAKVEVADAQNRFLHFCSYNRNWLDLMGTYLEWSPDFRVKMDQSKECAG